MQETIPIHKLTRLNMPNGKSLRNRIVIPPMASQTASEDGFVTAETLAHYSRLTEAQPGLMIVEYTFVDRSGRSEEKQLGASCDAHTRGLAKVAELIRGSGALAGLQLTHSGGKTERTLTAGILMAPSAIAVPVKDRALEAPTPMTKEGIELWKKAFMDAADRAVQAGFDLIEFHIAHGYGLNQWISPLTNQRNDAYGKDPRGRMRLPLEIISQARRKYPDLLISARIPGQDFMEGGLRLEDMAQFSLKLEKAGVNFIHVSSGIGGWKRPSARSGEGYLVDEAEKIQSIVRIPVIGVGGIKTGAYIDESLRKGRFSLAAIGRAILHDPKQWFTENLAQQP